MGFLREKWEQAMADRPCRCGRWWWRPGV